MQKTVVNVLPIIKRAPNEKELEALRKIFLKAETDIINEINRLRTKGNVDYHSSAALDRVQMILKQMEDECWSYVPQMIEKEFYVRTPEARKILEPVDKHISGYINAEVLTTTQHSIIDKLTANLMGEIVSAETTVVSNLKNALIGRTENDIYRQAGLKTVALMEAKGQGAAKNINEFVSALQREGVEAFKDKAGRSWNLHTYGNMVCRSTSRQAESLAVLTADEGHDLYKISSHKKTTCPVCAPFEGRVYSRSGKDKDFPPLTAAFGKIDKNGPDDLSNSYLNIHPNCRHILEPWTAAGRTDEEIQKIKDFSSFKKNPPTNDPRTEEQIEAYRKKVTARNKWFSDYRQWKKYKTTLEDFPKNFDTFRKHKLADDEKYKEWKEKYRKRFYLQSRLDYTIGKEENFIPNGAVFENVRAIAGKGSKTSFRHAKDYADNFGGKPEEWSKKVGKIESSKYIFDVHWVEKDGIQYDSKLKNRREKK